MSGRCLTALLPQCVMEIDDRICQQVQRVLTSAGLDNYAVSPQNGMLFPLSSISAHVKS